MGIYPLEMRKSKPKLSDSFVTLSLSKGKSSVSWFDKLTMTGEPSNLGYPLKMKKNHIFSNLSEFNSKPSSFHLQP
jgi:hypothetical protein